MASWIVFKGDRYPNPDLNDVPLGLLAEFEEVSGVGLAEIMENQKAHSMQALVGLTFLALRLAQPERPWRQVADDVKAAKLDDIDQVDDEDPVSEVTGVIPPDGSIPDLSGLPR